MVIIGSAQAVSILISILRLKVVALLLGPAGVGLLGIYNNLQSMVSTAAGLGMDSSGVRQIASAKGEEQVLNRVRRVLFTAHLVQGALAMLGVWLLRSPIAELLLGDREYAIEIGLIGLAIFLGLLGAAQIAILQGMRLIGDLGRISVLSALVGTAAGLAAVWFYGEAGLIWFVVVQPLATIVIALRYTRSLPLSSAARLRPIEIWEIWKPMAGLGAAFMLAGLATTATLLFVRGWITHELGLDAAGQFAAAWAITMTYVGFLLNAMSADYYPRLVEVINDRPAAIRLVNDQAQLGLAIGGPVLLLLIGLAPLVIRLLYTPQFSLAAEIVQWQTLGNIIKLMGWPLGFTIIAAARSKVFLFTQLNWNVIFLLILWFGLPHYGLVSVGIAFCVSYLANFAIVNILSRKFLGFRWQSLSILLYALHTTLALSLIALAQIAPGVAAISSPLLALATGVFGLRVVVIKMGPESRIAARFARVYAAIGWPIRGVS